MPLDFNISPYFDDYDVTKDYQAVLFRPAARLQARELNQLQSILREQIARVGSHIFEEGSVVIPGDLTYDLNYTYVKVDSVEGQTVALDSWWENSTTTLLGKTLIGSTSGAKAVVVNYLEQDTDGKVAIYIKYIGGADGIDVSFLAEEILTCPESAITLTVAASGYTPTGAGSAASIKEGIYLIYGMLLRVAEQTIILSPYSTTPSCRIGLRAVEDIYTSDDDITLNSNAQGTPNEGAPGAHRYKVTLELESVDLGGETEEESKDFFEQIRLELGVLRKNNAMFSDYSELEKTLARRTFDANGDFAKTPFLMKVVDCYELVGVLLPNRLTTTVSSGVITVNHPTHGLVNGDLIKVEGVTDSIDGIESYEINGVREITYISANSYSFVADGTATVGGISGGGNYVKISKYNDDKLTLEIDAAKAYVSGFEINKVSKSYVDIDKARDYVYDSSVPVNIKLGNYIYVKTCYGIPDVTTYGKVELRSAPTATPGTAAGSVIGYARCKLFQYYQGTPGDPASGATYKMYLFDIQMNAGQNFYNTKQIAQNRTSYVFTADVVLSHIPLTGSISASASTTVSGNGTVVSTNPSERLVAGDYISLINDAGNWVTVSVSSVTDDNTFVVGTAITATNKAFYYAFCELREPAKNCAIFQLPQTVVRSLRDSDGDIQTLYYVSREFDAVAVSENQVVLPTLSNGETFVPFSDTDYIASFVSGGDEIGDFIPLTTVTLGGTNTTCTIPVTASDGVEVKVVCTVKKSTPTASNEKIKVIATTGSLAVSSHDQNVITLDEADVISIDHVYMSADFDVAAEDTDVDIADRYELDNGQRDNYYALGRIIRKAGTQAPTGQLLIEFSYYTHSVTNKNYFSVDSYDSSDYENIPVYVSNELGYQFNLRDCLDFRPRIKSDGSGFANTGGGSLSEIPIRSEVTVDFSYYLNRIDKLVLDPKGNFVVRKGTSALLPKEPEQLVEGMLTHRLNIKAYTADPKDVIVDLIDNRGYTMRDIGKLEKRIENLEYYTSLTLLEKNTNDLLIPDENGLDRRKSGFTVDNFTGTGMGEADSEEWRCSIDMAQKECRPGHEEGYINLIETDTANRINNSYTITGPLLSLPYVSLSLVRQPLCSSYINVNPHNIVAFIGHITLDPPFDEWKDTKTAPELVVTDSSNYDAVMATATSLRTTSNPTGVIWDSWETTHFGEWKSDQGVVVNSYTEYANQLLAHRNASGEIEADDVFNETGILPIERGDGTYTWPYRHVDVVKYTASRSVDQSRNGIAPKIVSKTIAKNLGEKVIDVSYIPYIRSRSVSFVAKGLRPETRVFPFFDNTAISRYCYETSPVLNTYNGELVTDETGSVSGVFTIPNSSALRFEVGERQFKLSSSPTNSEQDLTTWASTIYRAQGLVETKQNTILSTRVAEIVWSSVTQTRTITEQQAWYDEEKGVWVDPLSQSFMVSSVGGAYITKLHLYFRTKPGTNDPQIPVRVEIREMVNGYPGQKIVPFSQVSVPVEDVVTNYVNDDGDLVVTDDTTVTTLESWNINDFEETEIVFDSLVYLQDGTEYCITILSDCDKYELWKATITENMVGSEIPIQKQPYAGYLFTSKNASTWSADPTSVLMFNIFKSQFDIENSGVITFVNDELPPTTLDLDPIFTVSGTNKVRINHKNHGMFPGSSVVLSGVVTVNSVEIPDGTYLLGSGAGDVDLNSYCITVGTSPTNDADATGWGGGSVITATENRPFDVLYPVVGQLLLSDTNIDYYLRTTTGRSISGTEAIYNKETQANEKPVIVNQNISFTAPRTCASGVNESLSVSADGITDVSEKKSLVLKAVLTSENENVSPVIDTARLSAIGISNIIDDPDYDTMNADIDEVELVTTSTDISFTGSTNTIASTVTSAINALLKCSVGKYIKVAGSSTLADNGTWLITKIVHVPSTSITITVDADLADKDTSDSVTLTLLDRFVDEIGKGSARAKYVHKRMVLAQPATGLHITFAAYRDQSATIDVYYKVSKIDDATIFDDIAWVKATPKVNYTPSVSETSFKDYEYTINDLDDFTVCNVKIVMRGTNSAKPPRVKDLRIVALAV